MKQRLNTGLVKYIYKTCLNGSSLQNWTDRRDWPRSKKESGAEQISLRSVSGSQNGGMSKWLLRSSNVCVLQVAMWHLGRIYNLRVS